MSFLGMQQSTEWKCADSISIGISAGIIAGGIGWYELENLHSGKTLHVNYANLGVGTPTAKAAASASKTLISWIRHNVTAAVPFLPGGGWIWTTPMAPAGERDAMFSSGFFWCENIEASWILGGSGTLMVWFPFNFFYGIPSAFSISLGCIVGSPHYSASVSWAHVISSYYLP